MPRGGVLAAIEGDRHILTLSGILGDHPPIDPAEFEAFAATLIFPDITPDLVGAENRAKGLISAFAQALFFDQT